MELGRIKFNAGKELEAAFPGKERMNGRRRKHHQLVLFHCISLVVTGYLCRPIHDIYKFRKMMPVRPYRERSLRGIKYKAFDREVETVLFFV